MKCSVVLKILITLSGLLLSIPSSAQHQGISHYDTLRGKLHEYRNCLELSFYDLQLRINPAQKSISGKNAIHYKSTRNHSKIQIDLFSNFIIDSVISSYEIAKIERDSNFIFVRFKNPVPQGAQNIVTIHYSGKPQEANNPPWDGGFVWSKDSLGRTWAGVAVEGIGASLWWPNIDHISVKPDSMHMAFEVPDSLVCASNGRLEKKIPLNDGYTRYHWKVTYPINNYNVTMNLAHYASFDDHYLSQSGDTLDLQYYVLDYNLEKAKKHFKQVHDIIGGFENLYAPYPFIRDSYKLIETSYWGMEHQSGISYGNNYKTDYFDFDYIILHESAHEWWGNSITAADHGELWIHESFATYTEALYIEKKFGYHAALQYLAHQKKMIKNKEPMLGPLHVNFHHWEHPDMYYKGAWMLHSLRHYVNNDDLWFQTFKDITNDLAYTIVNTQDIINYFSKKTGKDLQPFFDRYLKFASPPNFIYKIKKRKNHSILTYHWDKKTPDFDMPLDLIIDGKEVLRIYPTTQKQKIKIETDGNISIKKDFYIKVKSYDL
ncbi:M1 family metallopeptidase [Cytophagaceae bacterium ABcell3]|nr:M1 family metallopeptidase [Cytophagaceae bacterium ABcell3]